MLYARLSRSKPKLGIFFGVVLAVLLAISLILVAIIACLWKPDDQLHPPGPPIICPENAPIVKKHSYNRSSPFIFISGFPHCGENVVQELLRASWEIHCSMETNAIPRILKASGKWVKTKGEKERLELAGLNDNVISDALASFIIEIIFGLRTQNQSYLCNHDPFILLEGERLHKLFPKAKFIFMVRDGRAVVHSLISKRIKVPGYNITDYRNGMMEWSQTMELMLTQCEKIGEKRCMQLKYEELIRFPTSRMIKLGTFLGVEFPDESQKFENILRKLRPSLNEWIPAFKIVPKKLEISFAAPILKRLGYETLWK